MEDQPQLPSPPDAFLSPLLELRDYYVPLAEKYKKLYTEALTNLNHVEALLSSWGSTKEVSEPVASNSETLLLEDSNSTPEHETNLVDSTDSEVAPTVDELQNIDMLPEASEVVATADEEDSLQAPLELLELSEPQEDEQPPELQEQSPEKSLLWSEIPMLPQYQSLNRTEAILKVLQQHRGTVCHIDFIVRSLYGDLEPEALKVVKGRVQSSLTHGRESGKWSLIPDEPGCYTLDLKLLNSNRSRSSRKSKNRKPSPVAQTNLIPMIGEFEGQFLIDALTCFFEQNPGKIFTVAEVIEQLYGELDAEDFREVKPKVLNELSRGHRTGRFSRVPGEIGLYTLDSKLLTKANAR
ncbi:hypothetical protein VB735_18135 [Halotia wernerae UHCC 0503]|nr:hypothetical protein [Halotia wernerae UHCC 0503]